MPENESAEKADKKGAKPSRAGDFAGVRRRGGAAARPDRAAQAAALMGHAENTADASFLGGAQGITPPEAAAQPASAAPATPLPAQSTNPAVMAVIPVANLAAGREATAAIGPQDETEANEAATPAVTPPPGAVADPALASASGTDQAAAKEADGATSTGRRRKKLPPMQQALQDSYVDSRIHSRQWDSHGVNLIPALWPALRARLSRDRKSSGNSNLGLGHYIDVALRQTRLDTDYLIGLHDALNAERMGDLPRGRKTTLSLSPQAREAAEEVIELLEAADFARKGKDVMSALVLNFLRALEKEGPLPKPELPPLI
ncbi:hypothetical protein AB0J01_28095 [Streptomyces sp. NPDC050204]|uniref:hypothetical protein n=1 Tax=Streptomyces sp. NPDC050204 TaxID=3155514 RepID=UPI00341350F9